MVRPAGAATTPAVSSNAGAAANAGNAAGSKRLLEVRDLTVSFPTRNGPILGVDQMSLNVGSHERLGVVGESGSGKSVMGLAMLGMVLPPGRITGGSVRWKGHNVLDPEVASRVRGREIAMI